ncbi:hypothetical protein K438DRAFT_1968878 [Mycena galopus ATCC 62051]|nr:hypothetical protein K438DRAFT_1968878 [Mycena galopus ATCC 62051]
MVEFQTVHQDDDKGPNKARIITKPSITSTSSSQFGGERMIRARQGLLVRQNLEESCLIAEGEDVTSLRPAAVFTRPSAAAALSSELWPTAIGAWTAQSVLADPAIEDNANVDMSPTVLSSKRENAWGVVLNARLRVASAARCSALGWVKRSSTKENQNQTENTNMGGMSFNMIPGESLRLSHPRPRGRPTPARAGAVLPHLPIAAI